MEPSDTRPTALPVPTARDSWAGLRAHTTARIALGRSGGSQRTQDVLDFRLSHAQARDAVTKDFDAASVAGLLEAAGIQTLTLSTAVDNRAGYLLRPDLGRKLSAESRAVLQERSAGWGKRDLAIILSDGLSPLAAERQGGPLLTALVSWIHALRWSLYPVFVVPYARVKIQDEIGELLGAKLSLAALGERPGLGAPDSLGVYFTWAPKATCTDADRNCISNIRPEGFPPEAAAGKIVQLLQASRERELSGVALKDDATLPPLPARAVESLK